MIGAQEPATSHLNHPYLSGMIPYSRCMKMLLGGFREKGALPHTWADKGQVRGRRERGGGNRAGDQRPQEPKQTAQTLGQASAAPV